ncbi:ABC transporter ATP-binding protein [Agrobacterium arsenijevicii]|uniref:ABC transporter ATP-binding protein n=1 Tax=Agrobacterium arsenijevicii TaxID=1585697 RepID=UPI0005D304DA
MSKLLVIEDIHVRYGDMIALRGVSLHVETNEIVCIIGPNGAGKSTTLAAVAGGVAPFIGSVLLAQSPISGLGPENISKLGVSLVPEGRHIFGSLTVDENLMIGSHSRSDRKAVAEDRANLLDLFPRLGERLKYPAGRLSGGEQQMLAIARAIMTKPKLLLVDEPSLGLAPKIVDQIYEILQGLRKREGLTLLINEQSSNRILKHADRIYVLRAGQIQLEGKASDFAGDEQIRQAYFGFDDTKGDYSIAEISR